MQSHHYRIITTFLIGLFIGILLFSTYAFIYPNATPDSSKSDSRLLYKWYPPETPKAISFCGEEVPLNRWEVKERLERELLVNYYMHGSLLYILKLTSRYFPVIEKQLKANGIPDDFKYLCVAESSLQHLTSPAGAQSLWQFLSATGAHYGLQIDGEVDERYNVLKATDAACKYFKEAYAKFGNWTAAAASYNCGMGGYNNFISSQQVSSYYDVLLPEETNRYVFRILALKYLISNANAMGYIVQGNDAYKPFHTKPISVTNSIPDLISFAKEKGTTLKMIRLLNPWLRAKSLTIKNGKTYWIEIPD